MIYDFSISSYYEFLDYNFLNFYVKGLVKFKYYYFFTNSYEFYFGFLNKEIFNFPKTLYTCYPLFNFLHFNLFPYFSDETYIEYVSLLETYGYNYEISYGLKPFWGYVDLNNYMARYFYAPPTFNQPYGKFLYYDRVNRILYFDQHPLWAVGQGYSFFNLIFYPLFVMADMDPGMWRRQGFDFYTPETIGMFTQKISWNKMVSYFMGTYPEIELVSGAGSFRSVTSGFSVFKTKNQIIYYLKSILMLAEQNPMLLKEGGWEFARITNTAYPNVLSIYPPVFEEFLNQVYGYPMFTLNAYARTYRVEPHDPFFFNYFFRYIKRASYLEPSYKLWTYKIPTVKPDIWEGGLWKDVGRTPFWIFPGLNFPLLSKLKINVFYYFDKVFFSSLRHSDFYDIFYLFFFKRFLEASNFYQYSDIDSYLYNYNKTLIYSDLGYYSPNFFQVGNDTILHNKIIDFPRFTDEFVFHHASAPLMVYLEYMLGPNLKGFFGLKFFITNSYIFDNLLSVDNVDLNFNKRWFGFFRSSYEPIDYNYFNSKIYELALISNKFYSVYYRANPSNFYSLININLDYLYNSSLINLLDSFFFDLDIFFFFKI